MVELPMTTTPPLSVRHLVTDSLLRQFSLLSIQRYYMLPMQRYEQNKKLNESGVDGYLLVPRVVRIGDPLQDASLSVQSSQNTLYSAQAQICSPFVRSHQNKCLSQARHHEYSQFLVMTSSHDLHTLLLCSEQTSRLTQCSNKL